MQSAPPLTQATGNCHTAEWLQLTGNTCSTGLVHHKIMWCKLYGKRNKPCVHVRGQACCMLCSAAQNTCADWHCKRQVPMLACGPTTYQPCSSAREDTCCTVQSPHGEAAPLPKCYTTIKSQMITNLYTKGTRLSTLTV